MTVSLAARDIAAAAGAILILGAVVSVVGTVIVPRNTGGRLTRLVTRVVNGLFRVICRPVAAYRRRDRIMAGQAAVILLGQIAVKGEMRKPTLVNKCHRHQRDRPVERQIATFRIARIH